MGWQDRSYYRDSSQGAGNPFMWLLTGSVPLFTAFGIRVRAHAMLIVAIVLILLFGVGFGRPVDRLIAAATLFGIVLLHEFGHCFAARRVGGHADEIIMHPLGGAAMASAPRRPWPTFVTVAGGPLVNLVLCAAAATVLWLAFDVQAWNLLNPKSLGDAWMKGWHDGGVQWATWGSWVFFIHLTSWALFVFNMLPIYPLDGGQMLQSILWPKFGYYKSMLFAAVTGIVGGGLMVAWGLIGLSLLLILIGVMGVINCISLRRMLLAEGPWAFQEEDSVDYSSSLFNTATETTPKHKKLNKRLIRKAQKREEEELAEQERVDRILAKVSANGMHSLTWWEKRTLHRATERQRKRDLELKEEMTRKGF
jgi:Zn-dependent protease